jgi:hypothetical protein
MNNKLIWILREPRSGSSWVCHSLTEKLNKPLHHYEAHLLRNGLNQSNNFDSTKFQDQNTLYSTHLFKLFPKLKEIEPYVIRTTRRNKAEQCMSMLYWKYFPHSIKHYYVNESSNVYMDNFNKSLENPATAHKKDIIDIMSKIKERDQIWEDNFQNFKTDVIVYEDLINQVHLPELNVKLSFSEEINFSHKMPEYKTKAFKNYDQIVEWCDEIIPKLNFIQY